MAAETAGARAVLAQLDRLLAEQPHRESHDFSEATRRLTALRAGLIERQRSGQAEQALLARLNPVLSIVVGTHYPVGAPKWQHMQEARESFAGLMEALEAAGLG